jgi:hypothetical protein
LAHECTEACTIKRGRRKVTAKCVPLGEIIAKKNINFSLSKTMNREGQNCAQFNNRKMVNSNNILLERQPRKIWQVGVD